MVDYEKSDEHIDAEDAEMLEEDKYSAHFSDGVVEEVKLTQDIGDGNFSEAS